MGIPLLRNVSGKQKAISAEQVKRLVSKWTELWLSTHTTLAHCGSGLATASYGRKLVTA
jgi:hypothetical protein